MQILWRPQEETVPLKNEETGITIEQKILIHPDNVDMEKISKIKKLVSKKLPNDFSIKFLDDNFGWLEHPRCQYNPKAVMPKNYELKSYGDPFKKRNKKYAEQMKKAQDTQKKYGI